MSRASRDPASSSDGQDALVWQIENNTLKRLETLPEAQGLKDCS